MLGGLRWPQKRSPVPDKQAILGSNIFPKHLPVNSGSAAVWQRATVAASGEPTITGYRFVLKTPEQFSYGADGDMTNDGRWSFSWDAENRLLKAESSQNKPKASLGT